MKLKPSDLQDLIIFIKNATHADIESAFIQLASMYTEDAMNIIRGNTDESDVKDMILAGYNKIAVIRALRFKAKVSLREAKDFVEGVADKHGLTFGNLGKYDFSPKTSSLADFFREHVLRD